MLGRFLWETGFDAQGSIGVFARKPGPDDGQLCPAAGPRVALRSWPGSNLRPEGPEFRVWDGPAAGSVVHQPSRKPYPALAGAILVAAPAVEGRTGRAPQARSEEEA